MMITATPTLGMRLDAMISSVDTMSSFQMYSLIVAVTLVLCLALLGTGNEKELLGRRRPLPQEGETNFQG
jgi:hypothetical protein